MAAVTRRSMAGRIAADTRWAHESDRAAATAPARRAFADRFEREVDPQGLLPLAERKQRAARLRRAHMTRLALRSAEARRRKRGAA